MEIDVVLDEFRRLAGIAEPDRLTDRTPCAEWEVADLLGHVVGGGHLFGAALAGRPHAEPAPSGDLLRDLDEAIAVFRAGASSPGAADRMVELPFGSMPGSVALTIGSMDVLVHTWDLATALGEPLRLPATLAEEAEGIARAMIGPEMRAPGVFDPPTDAPPGAGPFDRLAAFAGRHVAVAPAG